MAVMKYAFDESPPWRGARHYRRGNGTRNRASVQIMLGISAFAASISP
jgi:hypothetical protein